MENINQTKAQIRKYYKAVRNAMQPESVSGLSKQISAKILSWELYRQSEKILFYYPRKNEVSLLPVMEDALLRGKQIAFPKVTDNGMDFYMVASLDELKEGSFHVMEPQAHIHRPVHWRHALCFVPGTVFDQAGHRFGYGGGYYDRYFAHIRDAMLVGCAYGCQIAERLPVDAWDIKMGYLATENGICPCAGIDNS